MITGIAIHLKTMMLTIATPIRIYWGKLFFKPKLLNFNPSIGSLEIIKKEINKTKTYKNHLFNKSFKTNSSFTFQYISGKEATSKPTAGVGMPLNETV